MPAKIHTFTDEEFSKIVEQSNSMADVAKRLGYTSHSGSNGNRIRYRIDQLNLSTDHFNLLNRRPQKRNPDNIFIRLFSIFYNCDLKFIVLENSTAAQKTLRSYYKKGEYTKYQCAICGQEPFWNGKELTLILDHINGKNHDDRLENLRWVCPNCNQQLDTTNGKNIVKQKESV